MHKEHLTVGTFETVIKIFNDWYTKVMTYLEALTYGLIEGGTVVNGVSTIKLITAIIYGFS